MQQGRGTPALHAPTGEGTHHIPSDVHFLTFAEVCTALHTPTGEARTGAHIIVCLMFTAWCLFVSVVVLLAFTLHLCCRLSTALLVAVALLDSTAACVDPFQGPTLLLALIFMAPHPCCFC